MGGATLGKEFRRTNENPPHRILHKRHQKTVSAQTSTASQVPERTQVGYVLLSGGTRHQKQSRDRNTEILKKKLMTTSNLEPNKVMTEFQQASVEKASNQSSHTYGNLAGSYRNSIRLLFFFYYAAFL